MWKKAVTIALSHHQNRYLASAVLLKELSGVLLLNLCCLEHPRLCFLWRYSMMHRFSTIYMEENFWNLKELWNYGAMDDDFFCQLTVNEIG